MPNQYTNFPVPAPKVYMQRKSFSGIQALRGLAACMVVVYHSTNGWSQHNGGFVLSSWASGVDIFFVISGFVMAISGGNKSPSEFIRNRIIRIVPLYWIMTALAFIKIQFFTFHLNAENGFGAQKISAVHALYSLLFIPYVNTLGNVSPVLGQGWTLNCEMFFYVLFAAVLVFRIDVVKILVPLITAIAVIGLFQTNSIASFVLNPILAEFAAGLVLGALVRKIPEMNSTLIAVAGIAGLACLCTIPSPSTALRPLEWGIPATCVVLFTIHFEDKLHAPKWVLSLGNASYALYLSHTFVLILVIRSFINLHLASESLATFTCLLASIAGAYFIHRYIDNPLTVILKSRKTHSIPIVELPIRVT